MLLRCEDLNACYLPSCLVIQTLQYAGRTSFSLLLIAGRLFCRVCHPNLTCAPRCSQRSTEVCSVGSTIETAWSVTPLNNRSVNSACSDSAAPGKLDIYLTLWCNSICITAPSNHPQFCVTCTQAPTVHLLCTPSVPLHQGHELHTVPCTQPSSKQCICWVNQKME